MHPHDKELYKKLLNILPTNGGSIEFLRTFDFKSYHFAGEKLNDLENFKALWNGAEYEFVDEALKEKLKILKVKTKNFLLNVFHNVYSAETQGFYKVLREFNDGSKNEKYDEIVARLHNDADEVVKARENLINTYIERSANKESGGNKECTFKEATAYFFNSLSNASVSVGLILGLASASLSFGVFLSDYDMIRKVYRMDSVQVLRNKIKQDELLTQELNKKINLQNDQINELKASVLTLESLNKSLVEQIKEYEAIESKNSTKQQYLISLSNRLSDYISEYNKISAYDVDTGGHYSTALEKEGYYDKVRKANNLREIIFGIAKELDLKELQKTFAPR